MTITFVIGPPRSGTTLLKDLLARHPALTVHGETFHRFHHDLMLFPHRRDEPEHYRLTARDASPAIRDAYRQALDEARRAKGVEHVVVKVSTMSQQVDYLLALFPEARVVQMVRDGRDVACSMEDLRLALSAGHDEERTSGPAPDLFGHWCAEHGLPGHLRGAASWFFHVTRSFIDMSFAEPEQTYRLRYEDLLADPAKAMGPLLAFLELQPSPEIDRVLEQVRDAPQPNTALGFSTTETRGPRRVGRHADELSSHLRVLMAPILGYPMRLLGYVPDPWPEVEPFVAACEAYGIDWEAWRDKSKQEVAWFERQREAFLPRRMLGEPPLHESETCPLLIEGAWVGWEADAGSGAQRGPQGFVQKQDRRVTFADPHAEWPKIARLLDGTRSLRDLAAVASSRAQLDGWLRMLFHQGLVGFVEPRGG